VRDGRDVVPPPHITRGSPITSTIRRDSIRMKLVIATLRHAVGNKWVRIHVPRVAQLAHISSPAIGSGEAAQGESHSFRNPRGHRSLPTRAIILSKGGISARCYYERGEC